MNPPAQFVAALHPDALARVDPDALVNAVLLLMEVPPPRACWVNGVGSVELSWGDGDLGAFADVASFPMIGLELVDVAARETASTHFPANAAGAAELRHALGSHFSS